MSDQETETTTEPSIADLAKEFEVQQEAPVQQADTSAQNNASAPDPYDTEGYAKYMATVNAELSGKVNQLTEKLTSFELKQAQEAEQARYKASVSKLTEKLDGEPERFVRAALIEQYAENPDFKKIYDNQHQNPAAFDKALDRIAEMVKSERRPDPTLEENQRAVNDLMKGSSRSSEVDDYAEKVSKMSDAEFDRHWSDLRHGRAT